VDAICLNSLEATQRFGQWLAERIPARGAPALLLHGELGSGKTALTRALVSALPGGERAEVSSPSFTVCNHYPTSPPVLHCDLYRCQGSLPDEIFDGLERSEVFCIIEWAEYLPEKDWPENCLDIRFKICNQERLLILAAHGPDAESLVQELRTVWPCEA